MIFIGIFGGNGGDVVGKQLFLFIIEGDKKVILLILIKCLVYYFYFLKRIFGYFGNECFMIIYMMNKFIIVLSSKI